LSLLALALKGGEKKLPYLDYETWCLVKGALACLELRLPYLPEMHLFKYSTLCQCVQIC
jgi:hypothetical protein